MTANIKLTQGKYAIVDDEDFEKINKFKWCAHYKSNGRWYAVRTIRKANDKQATLIMHRMIMNVPTGLQIDHRNHNGLDNRKCNLRICTNTENRYNLKSQEGTSKYKGVYWNKINKKWIVQIQLNGKSTYLGSYLNEIDGALAYDIKATELFGEFAYLNFNNEEV